MVQGNNEYVTRAELASYQVSLAGTMAELRGTCLSLGRTIEDLEPLLLARSGDRQEVENMKRDIAASFEKHRSHYHFHEQERERARAMEKELDDRINRLASRVDKMQWLMMAAFFVVQMAVTLILPALQSWVKGLIG